MPLPALVLACALALQQETPPSSPAENTAATQVTGILVQAAGAPAATLESLARRWVALGDDAIPLLLDVLETHRLPGAEESLGTEARTIADSALGLFGSTRIVPVFAARFRAAPGASRAHTGLEILATLGRPEDLGLALDCHAHAASAMRLELAVAGIFSRNAAATTGLRRAILTAEPETAATLVRGSAAATTPEALQLLEELLVLADLDGVLLPQLAVVARKIPWEVRRSTREHVRAFLAGADVQQVASAALAAGALHDSDALEQLIEFLGHDARTVRDAAHHALRECTGLGLAADPAVWRSWHAGELVWFERQAPRVGRRLSDPDPLTVIGALRELAAHRFRRVELCEDISRTLAHTDARVRLAACSALLQLGSRQAIPALARATGDPDADVAREAWRALTGLCGPAAGQAPEDWRRAIRERWTDGA